MSIRLHLARALGAARGPELLLRSRRRRTPSFLSIVNFHSVAELPGGYPYDHGVVDGDPKFFVQQMRFLKQHCQPVSLSQVRGFFRGEPLPPNPTLVTFDDGYRNNVDYVLPILKQLNLPATFFVATGYISSRQTFWWDLINHHLRMCKKAVIELTYPCRLVLKLREQPKIALRTLLSIVKETYGLDLERLMAELAEQCETGWSDSQQQRYADEMLMTWDDVRTLRDAGMAIGSHTRSHRTLHTIDRARVREELSGSRLDLERELNQECTAIAYPIGRRIANLPGVVDELERAGYEIGFTNGTGPVNLEQPPHRFDVPRMNLDRTASLEEFRCAAALPALIG